MFVTENQFFVFVACVAFGGVFGVIYPLFALIKKPLKSKIAKGIADVIYFALFTAFFLPYGYFLGFPSFRIYMPVGALVGLFLYMKSFYIILAKYGEKAYNKIKGKLLLRKEHGRWTKRNSKELS